MGAWARPPVPSYRGARVILRLNATGTEGANDAAFRAT